MTASLRMGDKRACNPPAPISQSPAPQNSVQVEHAHLSCSLPSLLLFLLKAGPSSHPSKPNTSPLSPEASPDHLSPKLGFAPKAPACTPQLHHSRGPPMCSLSTPSQLLQKGPGQTWGRSCGVVLVASIQPPILSQAPTVCQVQCPYPHGAHTTGQTSGQHILSPHSGHGPERLSVASPGEVSSQWTGWSSRKEDRNRQQKGSWKTREFPTTYFQAQEGEGINMCLAKATAMWNL